MNSKHHEIIRKVLINKPTTENERKHIRCWINKEKIKNDRFINTVITIVFIIIIVLFWKG